MTIQTITHTCGHIETQQMHGTYQSRDERVARLELDPCPSCRAEQAAAASGQQGLPVLVGSDKQVGWASDIRARLLAELDAAIARAKGSDDDKARVLAAYAKVRSNTDARYWIDNRSNSPASLIAAAAK